MIKFILGLLLTPMIAASAEWALVGNDGKVQTIIVATPNTILLREDGPWIRVSSSVGIGFSYNEVVFSAPEQSTFTVTKSSGM